MTSADAPASTTVTSHVGSGAKPARRGGSSVACGEVSPLVLSVAKFIAFVFPGR